MRRHTSFPVPFDARGTSAAIGNFDGVHLGHQAILRLAADGPGPLSVLTFEPHPREVFAPDAPPFRLMTAEARAHRLEKLGVAELFERHFDTGLAALSPEDFARQVIVGELGLSHATVGADFRFGRDRAGDADTLTRLGRELGFGVGVADLMTDGGTHVSSTRIRDALTEGRPRDAAGMLGHWHRIEGMVEHGEKRGRTLGYPTANLSVEGLHLPRLGVYAVEVDALTVAHRGNYRGVASLGVRPMFGENRPNLETFIFDFAGDLYGAEISVALVEFLRDEATFDGLDALIAQMDDDSARARAILAAR